MESETQKDTEQEEEAKGREEESPEGAPVSRASQADEPRPRRRGRFRRRVCIMCADKMKSVDYKNYSFLRRFVSDRGRIEGRRKAGTCAKHQRALAQAIKRARHLALLPYTPDHVRTSGAGPSR